MSGLRAVIFDLGGVVLGSPLHAIAAFEEHHGIPAGFVNRVVADTGEAGAWSRLERGLVDLEAFIPAFEADCREAGRTIDAREMMERMALASQPRPQMIEAIRRIRGSGLSAAALTNNWASEERDDGTRALREHFDHFFESSVLGLQKPDPRIYRHACQAIGIEPPQAVFLDDIGRNLKSARALGMTTLKVDDPDQALEELEDVLGLALRG
ncbi:MAG: HAD family hydrolase [Myxococcota bacterium]